MTVHSTNAPRLVSLIATREVLHLSTCFDYPPIPIRSLDWSAIDSNTYDASYEGEWELPVLGVVSTPAAVLVRPDGYVAWVGDGTERGLVEALTAWFGSP